MPAYDGALERVRTARIEGALEKSEARFRQVVEFAPNAIVMIDSSGRIEMVNAQAEALFGYGREELLGQSVEMLVPHRFRCRHPALRSGFFGDPQSRPMGAGRELFALRKDGSEFPVEIGLNPIETDEGTMVLSAIVDISDRKHKEERLQIALKEKELLLGEIHHRVKNNLQVIHSLLDLQSPKIVDPTALKLIDESQRRIKSMALIHQTLYESHEFSRVNFSRFLDSLVPFLVSSYSVEPDRIALSVKVAPVSLPLQSAMPCGLIVNELVSNALKHAFPNGAGGEVRIDLSTQPGNVIVLSVADDGVGLPEDLEPAEATTLGLQLVTLLADQLRGQLVTHRAKPTRFVLRFEVDP